MLIFFTVFFIAFRLLLGSYLVATGSTMLVLYGLTALVEGLLGFWNFLHARQWDRGIGGLYIVSWYLISCALIPSSGELSANSQTILEYAISSWIVAYIGITLWLGRAFSVGPTTVSRLVVTGPYRLCRHPLLAMAICNRLIFFIAFPSSWNFQVLLAVVYGSYFVARFEESHLFEHLPGYPAYLRWCRSRFLPYLWSPSALQPDCTSSPGDHLQPDCDFDDSPEFWEWFDRNESSLAMQYEPSASYPAFIDFAQGAWSVSNGAELHVCPMQHESEREKTISRSESFPGDSLSQVASRAATEKNVGNADTLPETSLEFSAPESSVTYRSPFDSI